VGHDLIEFVGHRAKIPKNGAEGKPLPFLRALRGQTVQFPVMNPMDELRSTMARLRGRDGCPWDQEQTHQSLARCLIDECSELLETIDHLDMPHMREELGDVLIQVVFHALLAQEAGHFDLDDVARDINAKLIRRHPHVFGQERLGTSAEVLVQWEVIKAGEKAARGGPPAAEPVFKALPPRLPALMFAEAVWKQIEKKKLPCTGVVDAEGVRALAAELTDASLGARLFALAAAARAKGLDPEGALRRHAEGVVKAVSARSGA
jgi:XTP/dITP diphosphohydrolase/tetrapyrrole methylase family protein/MazG family protein